MIISKALPIFTYHSLISKEVKNLQDLSICLNYFYLCSIVHIGFISFLNDVTLKLLHAEFLRETWPLLAIKH